MSLRSYSLRLISGDRRGNVAIITAVVILPLLALVGLALDWRMAEAVKRDLQDAADGAVLAGARTYSQSAAFEEDERETRARNAAQQLFGANVEGGQMLDPTLEVNFVREGEAVRVEGVAASRLAFGGLFGRDRMDVAVRSAAAAGTPRRLEVVLALDNTGSMAQANRMNLMRRAAKKFIDTLFSQMDQPDMLYVGVAPWTSVVNIKMERPNENWTPAEYNSPDPGMNGTGVASWPTPFRDFRDYLMFPYQHALAPALGGQAVTPARYGAFAALFGADDWLGCVRQADGERRVNGAAVTPFDDAVPSPARWQAHALEPGAGNNPNAQCTAPMLGLSASREQVKRTLDRMRPDGNTYQDVGLMWGMRMLSPRNDWSNFFGHTGKNKPKAYDPTKTRKVLILLTDGENVVGANRELYYGCAQAGRGGPAGPCWSSPDITPLNDASLDALLLDTCSAARRDGIELFTIAVDVNDATAINLLDRCAGGPNSPNFENIRGEDIESVLLTIAKQSVRLTE
jgi:Flp pilus assembly protein TadG